VRSPATTLEREHELRATLAQHLSVSDGHSAVLKAIPVCAVRGNLDTSCDGPSACEIVYFRRTAFDQERDGLAGMNAVEDVHDERRIVVVASAAD